MMQLSMLDAMFQPPPAVVAYEPPPRREVMTRAYSEDYPLLIGEDEPDPVETEVRSITTLVHLSRGFCTYAVQPPGSMFWSESGFRSFASQQIVNGPAFTIDEARSLIELMIDRELKGKLVKWWPRYCLQWRFDRWFEARCDRADTWNQWGPEKHEECWAIFDEKQAAAVDRMMAAGIDPNEVWRSRK